MHKIKSRSFGKALAISFAFIILGFTFFIFKVKHQDYLKELRLAELKNEFPQFLAEKLKKEKGGSKLVKIDVLSIEQGLDGMVRVAYSLLFDDVVSGQTVPSTVEATAVLENKDQVWQVVKVVTSREKIDF